MRNTGLLFFGGLLIIVGLAYIAGQVFQINIWGILWPLLLILLGVWLLLRPLMLRSGSNVDVFFIGDIRRSGTWQVHNEEYWRFIGDVKLNLTQADIPLGETVYRTNGFVNDVKAIVPPDVGVAISSTAFITSTKAFGRKQESFVTPLEITSENYASAERKIRLEVTGFISDIKVIQS